MMKNRDIHNAVIEVLAVNIEREIIKTKELRDYLADSNTMVSSSSGEVDTKTDVEILTREIYGMNTIKRMIIKMQSDIDVPSDALMDAEEKALYYKVIRFALKVKRFINKFKRK